MKRASSPWPLHSASNPASSLTPSPGPLSPPNVAPSTSLESSSSSLQPSLPLESLPPPSSSHFSLATPSIPFLTPSSHVKTAQPSFPSVSLPETAMTSINLSLTQISSSTFISWSNYSQQQSSLVNNSTTYNVTTHKTSNVIATIASSGIFGETPTSFMSSSIALVTSTTSPPDDPRILNLTFSLINETFHEDLNNASSAKFVNLSVRVNLTVLFLL